MSRGICGNREVDAWRWTSIVLLLEGFYNPLTVVICYQEDHKWQCVAYQTCLSDAPYGGLQSVKYWRFRVPIYVPVAKWQTVEIYKKRDVYTI